MKGVHVSFSIKENACSLFNRRKYLHEEDVLNVCRFSWPRLLLIGEVLISLIFAFPSFLVPSLMSTKGRAQLKTKPNTNLCATRHSSCGEQGRTQLGLPYLRVGQVSNTSLPSAQAHSPGNSAEQGWLFALTAQNDVLNSTDRISIG